MSHRLRESAEQVLSDFELVLRVTGAGRNRLRNISNLQLPYLATCSIPELVGFGMTDKEAERFKASLELSKRSVANLTQKIVSPKDVGDFLLSRYANATQESFVVMCLNTKNFVMSVIELYRGSVNSSLLRVAEVYREPIRLNSPAIIIAHNHPSGDPTPSADDVQTTKDIVASGKLLDIECLDHIIVGKDSFVSLRERGLGFY